MRAELGLVDRDAASRFLDALYRNAPAGSFVEVRFRVASGMGQCFHRASALRRVADTILALASRTDVYVGVIPRRRCGGGRDDLIGRAGVVWVDCDTVQSVAALAVFRPRPAMVVASGSGENRHAYWLLVQAVDLGRIERVNGQLACALGADQRAGDAARILRPPGALNTKHSPATPVRLLRVQSRRIALAHLERDLPRDVSLVRAAPPALRPRAAPLDPLLSIAPAVYVERLTGQRVGRARKVHCPFHEDRTPSLHVYDEPDRGWFCFGCRRGGSIYDLAALLWERGTRGEEFIELRRELEETMP